MKTETENTKEPKHIRCCDFITKKKRPISGASARRYYRWGGYILVNSIKYRLKSQVAINNLPATPLPKMRTPAGFFVWNQLCKHYKDKQYGYKIFAHSLEGKPPSEWEKLEGHLRNVAELIRSFAEPLYAG